MHLVPAAAVRLMKRRVLSRPGVNSLMSSLAWSGNLGIEGPRVGEVIALGTILCVILHS